MMANQFKDALVKVLNEDIDDGEKLDVMMDILEGEPIILKIMESPQSVTDADCVEMIIDKYILENCEMKKFRVGIYYQETCHVIVEAEDKHEAENKIYKYLEDNGIAELEIDCNGREYDTTDVKEIDDGINS